MKTLQNTESSGELKPSLQALCELQGDQQNRQVKKAPEADSDSKSISSIDNKKVSREDIELVQNLIERCLQLYMNRQEVVKTLLDRARIEPGFTTLVWQKLEEENPDFFRAYYIRLKLKRQIILFNELLEHQYHLMKYPMPPKIRMASIQNGIHPMPVHNLPMGYPVLQPLPMPATGHHHLDSLSCGLPTSHVVNGIPAPGNFNLIQMNHGTERNMIDISPIKVALPLPPCSPISSVSEMAVSPASVASSGHFPFTPEISGMGTDSSALDNAFTSNGDSSVGVQLGANEAGSSRDSLRVLGQIPWNFSLTDLTADLTNIEDLGSLENYPCSPFLLDSPEHDDIIDEYFAENVADQSSQSDEEKS